MFPHEKLHVYAKSLAFVAASSTISAAWNKNHAVVDQLGRASESLILNLADAARLRSSQRKLKALDFALGSGLECAGCLDIASIKGLLGEGESKHEKQRLSEIIRMLVGLRKAWENWTTHEDSIPYRAEPSSASAEPLFHHETLEVYGVALESMVWLTSLPGANELSCRIHRRIDESITGIILNIAEGNGRYSELDHRRFLDIAEGSAVKAAAYLDLAVHKMTLSKNVCGPGRALLQRVVAMLSQM